MSTRARARSRRPCRRRSATGSRTLRRPTTSSARAWAPRSAGHSSAISARIGDEARAQLLERTGALPDRAIACVGGGSNAIGTFIPFVDDDGVELIGVEAAGEGLDTLRHSAPLTTGARGVLHGAMSAVLQDEEGQILEAHSVSAGLDYPGVGPEHAWLRDSGRVRYVAVPDGAALAAFRTVAEREGILPRSSPHRRGLAARQPRAGHRPRTLSGHGDKDLAEVLALEDSR